MWFGMAIYRQQQSGSNMKITIKDLRKLNYCLKGTRAFLEQHGFDWNEFKRNGIDSEQVRKTNDGMALKLIEEVENGK